MSEPPMALHRQVTLQAERVKKFKMPDKRVLRPRRVNLQLFGQMGTGKSSLINAFFTAIKLDEPAVQDIMPVRNLPSTSVTPEYTSLWLTDVIKVGDIWGWSGKNYTSREFEYLLQGRLQNYTPEENIDKSIDQYLTRQQQQPAIGGPSSLQWDWTERVHCVLFTVPASSFDNDEYIARLSLFKSIAERRDIDVPYLVIITRLDNKFPDLRTKPEEVPNDERVKAIITALAKKLGINSSSILPSMGYTDEQQRRFAIDALSLTILQTALEKVKQWLERQDQKAAHFAAEPQALRPEREIGGH